METWNLFVSYNEQKKKTQTCLVALYYSRIFYQFRHFKVTNVTLHFVLGSSFLIYASCKQWQFRLILLTVLFQQFSKADYLLLAELIIA